MRCLEQNLEFYDGKEEKDEEGGGSGERVPRNWNCTAKSKRS